MSPSDPPVRTPQQRFADVLRRVPKLPCVLLHRGDAARRDAALSQIAEVMGGAIEAWDGAPSPDAVVLVSSLAELSDKDQEALTDALAQQRVRLLAAVDGDAMEAVTEGKLRPDLYYRLSVGAIDLDRVHP